ncbi:MAG TPA: SEC-C metal-binding domain-containing protein [Polyangiaceae bacterium]|jgi:hypothetical protein
MDPQASPTGSNEDAFDELRQTGETLADKLRARILSLGAAAVPPLLTLLEDDDAAAEDSPGQGWPPIHAVDLLTALSAEEAIAPMLAALRRGELEDILSNRIAVRLPRFGHVALEPVLTEVADVRDAGHASTLCEILASLGVRDERVWQALSRCFDEEPTLSAGFLARYGDKRALPLLEREILAFDEESMSSLARFDLRHLVDAYEELAGGLPEELADHVDHLLEQRSVPDVLMDLPLPAVSTKVGRNDPCPCGSGKKYKRCCLV